MGACAASRIVHAERRRGPTAARAASRRAARAAGGGAMIRSAAAAAAALVLCGLAMSAPSAAGAGGGSDDAAARASLELRVGASELAAVPAASRALFAKVLGRLDGMRGEMEELKADKRRSDERAESLSARITELEEKGCEDVREEEINEQGDEQEERENYMQPMLDPSRRHT